jgi:hypothetical protein
MSIAYYTYKLKWQIAKGKAPAKEKRPPAAAYAMPGQTASLSEKIRTTSRLKH